jgi:hypothetical protein
MLACCWLFKNADLDRRVPTTELAIKMVKTALPNTGNVLTAGSYPLYPPPTPHLFSHGARRECQGLRGLVLRIARDPSRDPVSRLGLRIIGIDSEAGSDDGWVGGWCPYVCQRRPVKVVVGGISIAE